MPVVELSLADLGLMTVEDAAAEKGVGVRAVQRWIASGLIPAAAVGTGNRTTYLLRVKDVKAFTKPTLGRPVDDGKPPKKRTRKPAS